MVAVGLDLADGCGVTDRLKLELLAVILRHLRLLYWLLRS